MAAEQEALEAALQERWDRATLDVYGDLLQSRGDPRGDLIAIDRQVRATGLTQVLADRRHAVLRAWLGETIGGRAWSHAWFRDGFVHLELGDERDEQEPDLAAVLASPAGPYLRSVRLRLEPERIMSVLELLGSARHPWLERLELDPRGREPLAALSELDLAGAMPRLRTLALKECDLPRFRHPALRRLELGGWPPVGRHTARELERFAAGMPNVAELELDLLWRRMDFEPGGIPAWASRFEPRLFPALRRLDLSPNEALYRRESRWGEHACDFAASLAARDRITHLALPSLRSSRDAARVRELLAAMPGLVELSFGRRYACFDAYHAELDHPAIVLPPARPWPPALGTSRDYACIELDDGTRLELAHRWCATSIETFFDDLAEPVRRAWCELWPVLEELTPWASVPVRFPARTLEQAMRAIFEPRRDWMAARLHGCAEAVQRRAIAPDEMVTLYVDHDEPTSYDPL